MANPVYKLENVVSSRVKGRVTFKGTVTKDGVAQTPQYVGPETSTEDSAKAQALQYLAELYNADIFDDTKIGTLTYVPPAAVVPSPAEVAEAKFFTDLNEYVGMLVAVKVGNLVANDKLVTDQFALVNGEFLPAYAKKMGGVRVP